MIPFQLPPLVFVHVAVELLDVAPADALLNVTVVPPAVYPVPESSVILAVAVGADCPSFSFAGVVATGYVDVPNWALMILLASVWSMHATRPPLFWLNIRWRKENIQEYC
jgi:hypothetical protein